MRDRNVKSVPHPSHVGGTWRRGWHAFLGITCGIEKKSILTPKACKPAENRTPWTVCPMLSLWGLSVYCVCEESAKACRPAWIATDPILCVRSLPLIHSDAMAIDIAGTFS